MTGNEPVYKSHFQSPDAGESVLQHACDVLQYPDDDFVESEIEAWLPGATEYDIPLMDLLYWEQRIGRWGSVTLREKDFAIRSISPFSNYDLLLTGLGVDERRRSAPEYDLIKKTIEAKWPALLKYDINPSANPLKAKVASAAPGPIEQLLKSIHSKVN
ncbi:hypothetical protein [Haladaptatus sp. NG-WS-4]